jgi:hypothetical protein
MNERDIAVMLEPLVTAAEMRNFDRSPTPIASGFCFSQARQAENSSQFLMGRLRSCERYTARNR